MFFFVGGIGPRTIILNKEARGCPSCGRITAYLKRTDGCVSLFFIPVFRVKKGEPFLSCEACGSTFDERGERPHPERSANALTCRRCGRPIEPDFKYCPSCGNPTRPTTGE